MPRGRSLIASLLLYSAFLTSIAWQPASAEHRSATAGVITLSAAPHEPVFTEGQWGFAWQRFVEPDWQTLPSRAFATVPENWNRLQADGKPRGQEGWGSFVLQVNCPPGESLAVEAPSQRTASRLFVNGTLVAAHGEPGPSAQQTRAAVLNRVPISREFACPLRLTMHISNFDHRAGGFVRPLAVAPAEVLARHREARTAQHTVLLSAYALTGLVALLFFAVRRRERVPLAFGLFCLAMAVYADMLGERLLLRILPAPISWSSFMQIEYLAWLAAMALFLLTLRGLFPAAIGRRTFRFAAGILGVGTLVVVVLPPSIYSYLAAPGQAIAVVVAAVIVRAMLHADKSQKADARILLAGMSAVLAALALDLLLIDWISPDRKFAPLGFALFLLSPALVIARRMSHALNIEERSRTLEENARLREDVERMSRHDLKAPLSSVIGVARLLDGDARLSKDQRELVGVLQRAGLRMLEMVNLSLGLYRMEKGSYEFRPQAVELREVIARVLVDLQPQAHASAVTVQMKGVDAPVYVRAEELLCYSIVANLVKNALEACAPGQQVSVTVDTGDPVALSVHNPGEVVPEIADRFFDKYVSAGKRGGAGLGTYSARLMARAQQGEVRLRTGPTQGTTLTLTLRPIKGEPSAARAATQHERAMADPHNTRPPCRVLLVDDDELSRLITTQQLSTPPFQVETAPNGQVAMNAMMTRWPDILLLDMEMPVLSGLETLHWVREHEAACALPRCWVVMLSGNDDEASVRRALAAGADRFLVKPVHRAHLLATLTALNEDCAPELRG